MTYTQSHVVLNLVDLTVGKLRGRWLLGQRECSELLDLYDSPPGYVQWEGPVALAVQLTRMLADPVQSARRVGLLNAIRRGAEGKTHIWCNRQMAGHLLCLFDCDARRAADSMN